MKFKTWRFLTLALVLSSLGTQALFASSTAGPFLKIDPSAKSYSMGQSGVVSALGAQAIGSNPANLISLPAKSELLSTYSSISQGVSYAHIAGAVNRSAKKNLMVDALGFSYTRLSVGDIQGRDSQGSLTGSFDSSDSQMSLSAAGNIRHLQLGITGKLVQSKIASYKANTVFAMDMGLAYGFKGFGRDMRAGLSLNNLGQGMKYLNQADPLPTALNLGLSANTGPLNLTGGLSQGLKGTGTTLNFGVEFSMGIVSLRAGMNALGTKGNKVSGAAGLLEGLSSGLGLRYGLARLDYAVGQGSADLGISHRMSLTLQFGKKAR